MPLEGYNQVKYTLLDLTQRILSSMDSDEVNSINDTVESTQVTYVIEAVYNDIISRADLPRHYTLFQLDPSLDTTKPTVMYRPSTINSIEWVKYDTRKVGDTDQNICQIAYQSPHDFIEDSQRLLVSSGNVLNYTITYNGNAISLYCLNDQGPRYYTSFDDQMVVFNAYDQEMDTTLQSVKTTCWGERDVTFQFTDTWTADLDRDQFTLLLNEAKSLAFAELKQTQHAKAEKTAELNWIHQQKKKHAVTGSLPAIATLPNYGRKSFFARSTRNQY